MNPIDIINDFYPPGSRAREILVKHSEAVAAKAIALADNLPDLKPDIRFIEEAAMIHDIGIFYTHVPAIGCRGTYPYVCHGYLGRQLMEEAGCHRHALVCERHVGAGLSIDDIERYNLPVPKRDMIPVTIEEQVICYADKFFSKKQNREMEALRLEAVIRKIEGYGPEQAIRFRKWVEVFEPESALLLKPALTAL